ncbi:MAG TPA: hypothetical protein VML55_05360 [Planctomycetaceae bacterium]|nr:hypothetical protein [Planctomycetaceae bacterium]
MSELTLNILDATRVIHARIDLGDAYAVVAALAAVWNRATRSRLWQEQEHSAL